MYDTNNPMSNAIDHSKTYRCGNCRSMNFELATQPEIFVYNYGENDDVGQGDVVLEGMLQTVCRNCRRVEVLEYDEKSKIYYWSVKFHGIGNHKKYCN